MTGLLACYTSVAHDIFGQTYDRMMCVGTKWNRSACGLCVHDFNLFD